MKKILKCLFIIIGTLIGAGFASGQEIFSFFNQFSDKGIIGIILSSVLFGIITYLMMNLSNKMNVSDYKSLVKNNKVLVSILKIFTFICFCIMIAAMGTYLKEQYGIHFWLGTSIFSVVCFATFLFQLKGLEKINNILVPLIILGMMMLGFCKVTNFDSNTIVYHSFNKISLLKNWILASFLYTGYNSILLIPILLEIKRFNLTKNQISMLSIVFSLVICIIALFIFYPLSRYDTIVLYAEMPALMVAKLSGSLMFCFYSVVMIFAIYTTAFSSGYAFLRLHSDKNYFKNCFSICVWSVLFAKIGFANLVNLFFPIFGLLGIIQIAYILLINKKQ